MTEPRNSFDFCPLPAFDYQPRTRLAFGVDRVQDVGELAREIGNEKASRAVGAANGRNPLSIIVPCHRVIGANGSLTGYGGGLDRKRSLLELEKMRKVGSLTLFD